MLCLLLLISATQSFKYRSASAQDKAAVTDKSDRFLAAQVLLIEDSDYHQLEQTVIRLKQAGVNTIILRVFQNIGDRPHKLAKVKSQTGVYFNTNHAPLVDDLLSPISELVHKHGLKLFALMTTLQCDWKISEDPRLQGKGYNFSQNITYTIRRLDPFNRQVLYYLTDLYRDLAAQNIDGILLQDDLVLRNTEGFGLDAQNIFQQDTKTALVPSELFAEIGKAKEGYVINGYNNKFWQWSKWKNQRLLKLAKILMDNAHNVNPQLKFGINLYYETVLEPNDALAWLSQDLVAALKYNFDFYALMAYHRQMIKEMGWNLQNGLRNLSNMIQKMNALVGDASKIWLKLQIKDWNTGKSIPTGELDQVLQIFTQIEGVNLAYVPHDNQAPLNLIKKYYLANIIPQQQKPATETVNESVSSEQQPIKQKEVPLSQPH